MFDTYLTSWLLLVAVFSAAVISPGPDFVMSIRNSLLYGRRAGVLTAIGFASGVLVHASYAVLGVGAVIAHSPVLFSIIKYAGAAYLIYLGVQALRSRGADMSAVEAGLTRKESAKRSDWLSLRDGFLTNLLNPKATLFFVALFTQLVDPGMPLYIKAVFGLTCAVMVALWFMVVTLLMTQPAIRKRYVAVSARIDKFFGVLLIGFGIRVAMSRL